MRRRKEERNNKIIRCNESNKSPTFVNRISGTMVSVLVSSVVDIGYDPRSVQTKDYKIGNCCFSAKFRVTTKTVRLGIRIRCPSGETCLPVYCCFSELALNDSIKRFAHAQRGCHHHFIGM